MQDYSIRTERQKDDVVVFLKGSFYKVKAGVVRMELENAIDTPGIFFFLDISAANFESDCFLQIFLDLLNALKKRSARLVIISSSIDDFEYFDRYAKLFEFAESRRAFHRQDLLGQLRQVGVHYSKRTGIRVTPGVAIVLTFMLLGWSLTLLGIIYTQNKELSERGAEIVALESEVNRSLNEIERLQSSIGPLRNLGLVGSDEERSSFGTIRDWMRYLDALDSTRREN